MSLLIAWWGEKTDAAKAARLAREADPGLPAWVGTCSDAPGLHPWSAVAGALERLPIAFDWDAVRARVHELVGAKR